MKQILVDGRLGRDAELRVTANGKKYVTFSLANNTHIRNADKTTWYDVTCFDQNTVENRLEYLKKGKYIFVCGLYDATAFKHKDGSIRVNEKILADRITFLQIGNNNNQQETQSQQNTDEPVVTTSVHSVPAPTPQPQSQSVGSSSNDVDDELPF